MLLVSTVFHSPSLYKHQIISSALGEIFIHKITLFKHPSPFPSRAFSLLLVSFTPELFYKNDFSFFLTDCFP